MMLLLSFGLVFPTSQVLYCQVEGVKGYKQKTVEIELQGR